MQGQNPHEGHHEPFPPFYPNPNTNANSNFNFTSINTPVPTQPSSFLIIGLFALRLAKRLIEGLDDYRERAADLAWLTNFLAPFADEYALASISGPRREDYLATYQGIIARMKRQPRYPVRFMVMNPDPSSSSLARAIGGEAREMSDAERLAVIDFCDAAGEWGSIVPIPAREAEKMIELASHRRVADLDSVRMQ